MARVRAGAARISRARWRGPGVWPQYDELGRRTLVVDAVDEVLIDADHKVRRVFGGGVLGFA